MYRAFSFSESSASGGEQQSRRGFRRRAARRLLLVLWALRRSGVLRRPRRFAGPASPAAESISASSRLRVQRTQSHADFVLLPVAAINERHLPLFREDAENIFELVHAVDRPAGEGDDLVVDAQSAAIGVRLVENLRDDDRPVRIASRPSRPTTHGRRCARSADHPGSCGSD